MTKELIRKKECVSTDLKKEKNGSVSSLPKRFFGRLEMIFDIVYLALALIIGVELLIIGLGSSQGESIINRVIILSGIMALVLATGDSFHLIPRILMIKKGKEYFETKGIDIYGYLNRGKQITSITMTFFYGILWHVGMLMFKPEYGCLPSVAMGILIAVRILTCFYPRGQWQQGASNSYGLIRNVPFMIIGAMVAILFWQYRGIIETFHFMWLGILLSFAFYAPVVLWVNKNPKMGMFMLPKTCMYIWMLFMFLGLTK